MTSKNSGLFSEAADRALSIPEIQQNLIWTASNFARENGVVCVLKDAVTVVADPKRGCPVGDLGRGSVCIPFRSGEYGGSGKAGGFWRIPSRAGRR